MHLFKTASAPVGQTAAPLPEILMRRPLLTILLAAAVPAVCMAAPLARAQTSAVAPAAEADFRRAAGAVLGLARAAADQPGASPALAVVMVRRGQPPVIWTHGRLSAEPGAAAADADTPFYVASQTKAFMGLLAVKLDAEGIFDLDRTIADVWPDVSLPEGADPAAITFRQLLSHQAAFENDTLTFRTAYTDRIPAADYGRLLSTASEPRDPGFRYSNLGYIVYAAALELETGRDWRDWLDHALFRPLGMTRSGARTSRFDGLPSYHRWMGQRGWDVFPGKPDDLMQAAGGLVVSPNDMARWLAVQLGDANPAVRPEWVALAQRQQVAADIQGDVIPCQGYALGWNLCRIGAIDVRAHGGSYTGVRSGMAVSPELGVAIAVFSNSDSLTGGLSQTLIQTFFERVQDSALEAPAPEAFGADYGRRLAEFAARRMTRVDQRRAEATWDGWRWRPAAVDLAPYAGRYRHRFLGDLVIAVGDGTVVSRLGMAERPLEPAAPDLFGLSDGLADPPSPVRFLRDGDRIAAVEWDGLRFERLD